MIKINEIVSDFELNAYHNDELKKIKLSKYKGKWVILIFYPADFTYVCPTELEDAADLYSQFKKEGAEVMSISTDTEFSHKAWHDLSKAVSKVKYPMLSDPTGKVAKIFGVYIEEGATADEGLALRGTFVIDPDGLLKTIEIHDNGIGRSMKETLRKLRAAKFVREHRGLVCPANWEEGEKTLKKGINLVGKI